MVHPSQHACAGHGSSSTVCLLEHNIDIPTLCHLDGLSDVGACRLCVVEIKGNTKLFPACVTTVFEGMEVTTETDRLKKHRKTILEMLFAERNHICSVCVSNGHCELQTLGQQQGVTHVTLPYRNPALPTSMPRTSASTLTTTIASAFSASRCVRVCAEIEERAHMGCDGPRQPSRSSSPISTSPGANPPAPAAANACRSVPPERSSTRARSAQITPNIPIFCLT